MEFTQGKLTVNSSYSRKSLAKLLAEPSLETSREGLFRVGKTVGFFVTLDKQAADNNVKYNDYFDDRVFYWESQNQQSLQSPAIRALISGELTPYLFVRREAKVRNETQEFVFAGRLEYLSHDPKSSNPVKFAFWTPDIPPTVGPQLKTLMAWKPGQRNSSDVPAALVEEARKVRDSRRQQDSSTQDSQGLEPDPEVRQVIELWAMTQARRYYERIGYDVKDVSPRQSYDLECRKGGEIRKVKVKGTRGDGLEVILTSSEVRSAQDPQTVTDLAICHGIILQRSNVKPTASAGKLRIVSNWKPNERHLTPTHYRLRLPERANPAVADKTWTEDGQTERKGAPS